MRGRKVGKWSGKFKAEVPMGRRRSNIVFAQKKKKVSEKCSFGYLRKIAKNIPNYVIEVNSWLFVTPIKER